MVREGWDQLDIGHRLVEDDAVDRGHVLGDEVHERLQVFRRAACALEWYDLAQGVCLRRFFRRLFADGAIALIGAEL